MQKGKKLNNKKSLSLIEPVIAPKKINAMDIVNYVSKKGDYRDFTETFMLEKKLASVDYSKVKLKDEITNDYDDNEFKTFPKAESIKPL